jgi:hypothetical protein
MKAAALFACLVCCLPVFAQNENPQASQPPSYANYSIMLVNPAMGGGAVVLMHNPKNELEFVPVNNTKEALSKGYVAVRAVELGEFISTLKEENARLTEENARLQSGSKQVSAVTGSSPSQAEIDAQRRAQAASQSARHQQMIQTWIMLQGLNRPQPYQLPMPVNPNANHFQTNCTTMHNGNTSTTTCN